MYTVFLFISNESISKSRPNKIQNEYWCNIIDVSAEFRYEAVAVIHKDLELNNLQGLKGLKSCHTGVGRNVGYKIPLTKLRKMGIIGGLNDTDMSPRENELKAFSELFSKACIVGKWSVDPTINQKLSMAFISC